MFIFWNIFLICLFGKFKVMFNNKKSIWLNLMVGGFFGDMYVKFFSIDIDSDYCMLFLIRFCVGRYSMFILGC